LFGEQDRAFRQEDRLVRSVASSTGRRSRCRPLSLYRP
jgi:hypothetical protein